MKSKLHGFFGALALLCILTFWTATVVSELFLGQASVVAVKNAVLAGMWVLIPAMAATGGSGFSLARARKGRLVEVKGRRMKAAAANGLLVLLPSAVNITLLVLNMRDGLRLGGRISKGGGDAARR